jgi:AcrR family transcriptional regulator
MNPMRSDARRNAARLLAAADAAFRDRGTGAPLEDIARNAGVAIGTLYKHFPTRRALVGAVLREGNDALFTLGEELTGHDEPGEALIMWVDAMIDHVACYSGLAALIADGQDNATSELHIACQRLTILSERLVGAAHQNGTIGADVSGADVITMVSAAAWARDTMPPEHARRLVRFTMAGMGTAGR